MKGVVIFKTALHSLMHHKLRSFLTMLGIVVGIASVVATLAFGRGMQLQVQKKIKAMGSKYIEIIAGNISQKGKIRSLRKRTKLSEADSLGIAQSIEGVRAVSSLLHTQETVTTRTVSATTHVKAGNEHFLNIIGRSISCGSPITSYHLSKRSKVAVLGYDIALQLFGNECPLSKTIFIQKVPFRVVGTLERIPLYLGNNNPNNEIYVPLSSARRYLLRSSTDTVHGIVVSAKKKRLVPHVVYNIKKLLRLRHHLMDKEPDDVTIFDQQEMRKSSKETSKTLTFYLLIIACISLLVGGIGVMNIMLVSVVERTREIGIRMALGATQGQIVTQFLTESVVLCLAGGGIGIIFGSCIPLVADAYCQIPTHLTPTSILISLSITVGIGILFGLYPAHKASLLDPVQALAGQ